jgi:two-component system, OmpR family, alkaline phosphatase synthesis response regulator PhoP
MTAQGQRILLVEDDRDLGAGLKDALEMEGYRVSQSVDGRAGLSEALSDRYALVILDVMLPRLSGFDVLQQLRRRRPAQAVLMLTARGQEIDRVRGLKLGADDYVTKPFSVAELAARVGAILRRAQPTPAPPERLELPGLLVDFRARRASLVGSAIGLTPREFEILRALAARRGDAVSREELLAVIWGLADDVAVSTRAVDQHVVALRRKLGDNAGDPRIIETVYGHGYRLAAVGGTA